MGKDRGAFLPAGYVLCCEQMARLIPEWIEAQCQHRTLDLQWHRWGRTVFAGGLDAACTKWLAASPDALELLAYLEEKTDRQGTLLQAKVVLESLGVKAREDH